jgi:hypothetical protein
MAGARPETLRAQRPDIAQSRAPSGSERRCERPFVGGSCPMRSIPVPTLSCQSQLSLTESAPAKRLRWRLGERGKVVGAEPAQVKEAVA